MLAHADLARYAGQFVWLELNFDNAGNRTFLDKYGAVGTPTFYIIDPQDGRVAATQSSAMSYGELVSFLERGRNTVRAKKQSPADAALARGDALLALKPAEAAAAYREALRLGPPGWPQRELAEASLVSALQSSNRFQECSEVALAQAGQMVRSPIFARTVIGGMWCLASAADQPWAIDQAPGLQRLAQEALSLPKMERDHRDELYRTLMMLAVSRKDNSAAGRWGDLWLAELDAIRPANNEQRTAVDIARVENIDVYGNPNRILPQLLVSEHTMPHNWNASLRVAQMERKANNLDGSIAACDRGLQRQPGPLGRSWLLQIKAGSLREKGLTQEARNALENALRAARAIPLQRTRDSNLKRIETELESMSPERTK